MKRNTLIDNQIDRLELDENFYFAFRIMRRNHDKHNWTLFREYLYQSTGIKLQRKSEVDKQALNWYKNRTNYFVPLGRNNYSFKPASPFLVLVRQATQFISDCTNEDS